LSTAPTPAMMGSCPRYFDDFENFCALKLRFMPKYVRLEVNEQKFNVLRHKLRFHQIYGLKVPAVSLETAEKSVILTQN